MGQAEVIKVLEKSSRPLDYLEIAKRTKIGKAGISRMMRILRRTGEVVSEIKTEKVNGRKIVKRVYWLENGNRKKR